jgi:hypothetical protein
MQKYVRTCSTWQNNFTRDMNSVSILLVKLHTIFSYYNISDSDHRISVTHFKISIYNFLHLPMNITNYVYKINNFSAHYMHQTSCKLLEITYMHTNNIYRIFLQINTASLLFIADSYFAVWYAVIWSKHTPLQIYCKISLYWKPRGLKMFCLKPVCAPICTTWKRNIMSYFILLTKHLSGRMTENSGQLASKPKIKPRTSQTQSRNPNHLIIISGIALLLLPC